MANEHAVDKMRPAQREALILRLEERVRTLTVKIMGSKRPISRRAYQADLDNVQQQLTALRAGALGDYHRAARSKGYVEEEPAPPSEG